MDPELKQALAEMEQTISSAVGTLARQTEQRFDQVDRRFGFLGHELRELRLGQGKILSDLDRYAILIGPVASGLGEIHETLGSLKRQVSEMSAALLKQRTVELQRFLSLSDRVGAIERHVGLPEMAND